MKNFMKRKRLNNKGFTLIELLAVVVILAIVMGISATSVLNSINNSRKSSLHSTAQTAANTLNTWISEDMLVTSNTSKKLGDAFISTTQASDAGWKCLEDLVIQNADGASTPTKKLWQALSLNETDLNLSGENPVVSVNGTSTTKVTVTTDGAGNTCSALRYNSSTGGYEILLVAKNGGKYFVSSGDYTERNYAFSRANEAGVLISD